MIILLSFAFLSGLVTILAPCIWPVLPIVLSSSVAGGGGHKRALGITLGVMTSFTIFTLSVSTLVRVFNLDPNILRTFAVVVIILLGFTMIIPKLGGLFEVWVSRLSNLFGQKSQQMGSGFLPGFITGLSLGIVWSPCAGPILATIATLAATGQVSFEVILVTLAYVIGVGIPLFAFAYGGQRFIQNARGINKYTGRIQQVFGVLMILTAYLIFTNKDKDFQLALINKVPALATVLNGFENSSTVTKELKALKGQKNDTVELSGLFNDNTPAPEFTGITKWLNPEQEVTLESLKGKVVLVDFWTYTCINCVRTLPHVTSWYDKYKDKGFVVIGVHTPEFAFEKETSNVLNAIKQFNIHYPVAQDNNYATWNAYLNQYWPAEYLIDAKGVIRRHHFGEGEYEEMELAIQTLLKEAGQTININVSSMPDQTPKGEISPETYVGSRRMEYEVPDGHVATGEKTFKLEEHIPISRFSFGGTWNIDDEYAEAKKNAVITYNFSAKHVYLVIKKGTSIQGKVQVLLDGKPIPAVVSGSDVKDGFMMIDTDKLYDIVNLPNIENHVLELRFLTPGMQAYAYTFG